MQRDGNLLEVLVVAEENGVMQEDAALVGAIGVRQRAGGAKAARGVDAM